MPNYAHASFEVVEEEKLTFQLESGVLKAVLLQGQLDIVAPDIVWEIKCITGELSTPHFLQVAIYAWLWLRNHPTCPRRFRLLNVLSGEMWELTPEPDGLDKMMQLLLSGKLEPPNVLSDDEFLEHTQALRLSVGHPLVLPTAGLGFLGSRHMQMVAAGWGDADCLAGLDESDGEW